MLRLLHTNDFHGTLDDLRMAKLSELRKSVDLYFDSGDCIKAGNLAIPLKPEAVWPRLASLRCSASVIGNRESHPLEAPFRAKLAGSSHPVLCANLRRKDGTRPLLESLVLEAGGLRIGVFGVMVPIVTERMTTRSASHYLWDEPIAIAQRLAEEFRPKVDCLVALTHIGFRKDLELAERCPSLDIILGGHSHTLLENPKRIGNVAICQTGSHGRYAGHYHWELGKGLTAYRLESLEPAKPKR